MAVTGSAQSEAYKALFNKAYGQAAELAKESKGDPVIARTLMQKLGYTRDELRTAGDDVARMQGVQSPHPRARIQPGEHVLDLGCGLGVDALIAAAAAGPGGRVCGVDLAEKEVLHARGAHAARLARRTSGGASLAPTSYHVGDMEALPFPDASFDVVISNGGFCLVPDKARAFAEVCRVLKPGGRCAIACTVNKADLDPSVKWPACMEVFMTVGDAPRLVGGAGLVDLAVTTDRTGGRMDVFDIDVDQVANEIAQSAATDSNGSSSSSSSSSSAGEFGEGEETLYANAEAAEDAEIAALEAAVAEAKSSCSHAVAAAERRLNEAAERIAGERQQRRRARAEADAEVRGVGGVGVGVVVVVVGGGEKGGVCG
jgi:SAM-dependent methyltransferase